MTLRQARRLLEQLKHIGATPPDLAAYLRAVQVAAGVREPGGAS